MKLGSDPLAWFEKPLFFLVRIILALCHSQVFPMELVMLQTKYLFRHDKMRRISTRAVLTVSILGIDTSMWRVKLCANLTPSIVQLAVPEPPPKPPEPPRRASGIGQRSTNHGLSILLLHIHRMMWILRPRWIGIVEHSFSQACQHNVIRFD